MIRLLLADDEGLIRRGIRALLSLEADLEVVGEAENGQTALEQVANLQPDVVLMDIRMPVMDGVVATQAIVKHFSQTKVLILTTFAEDDYITQALHYGASGYLLKDTPSEDIAQAIRSVHRGYTQLGPGIGQRLLTQLASTPQPLTPELLTALQDLTPREQEILQFIAAGASNREIAQTLCISEKTVKNHVSNILSRLNLRDRTQAAIFAHAIGLPAHPPKPRST